MAALATDSKLTFGYPTRCNYSRTIGFKLKCESSEMCFLEMEEWAMCHVMVLSILPCQNSKSIMAEQFLVSRSAEKTGDPDRWAA